MLKAVEIKFFFQIVIKLFTPNHSVRSNCVFCFGSFIVVFLLFHILFKFVLYFNKHSELRVSLCIHTHIYYQTLLCMFVYLPVCKYLCVLLFMYLNILSKVPRSRSFIPFFSQISIQQVAMLNFVGW